MTDLPPAAIERAAEAVDVGMWVAFDHRDDLLAAMHVALTAALPVIEQMHRAAHAEEFAVAISNMESEVNQAIYDQWGWAEHDRTTSGGTVERTLPIVAALVRSLGALDAKAPSDELASNSSVAAAKETTE